MARKTYTNRQAAQKTPRGRQIGCALGALLGLLLLIHGGRVLLAPRWVAWQNGRSQATALADVGSTRTLRILPLIEAGAQDNSLAEEFGLAYLIRTDTQTILFDVGYNPEYKTPSPLEKNMKALGVRLEDIDALVIALAQPDHVGGLSWWQQGTFSLGTTQVDLGERPLYLVGRMDYPSGERVTVRGPQVIGAGLTSTGPLPYLQPMPAGLVFPTGIEQSLVVRVAGQGIVLITGCGHAGIEALLRRVGQLFPEEPVVGLIGGLHYGERSAADMQPDLARLQALNLRWAALSPHDSGRAALGAFHAALPRATRLLAVGSEIQIP